MQPNKTKLDQIPSVFEVKAWGKYMDNSNGKSKRKKYGVEGDDTSDDAEVDDMVESTTFEVGYSEQQLCRLMVKLINV